MSLSIMNFYRFQRIMYKKKVPILPQITKAMIRVIFAATIPYKCEIGEKTRFPHGAQGVVLHDNCIIGKGCTIQANVVIGGRNGLEGAPCIGNNVLVGVGAAILGNIIIGDNVTIGANSVVTKSIPDNAVVMGVPGVIKRYIEPTNLI